jgi:hypothetical protein
VEADEEEDNLSLRRFPDMIWVPYYFIFYKQNNNISINSHHKDRKYSELC